MVHISRSEEGLQAVVEVDRSAVARIVQIYAVPAPLPISNNATRQATDHCAVGEALPIPTLPVPWTIKRCVPSAALRHSRLAAVDEAVITASRQREPVPRHWYQWWDVYVALMVLSACVLPPLYPVINSVRHNSC